MAILDIILLICFVPAIIIGISKGLVKQVVELAALLIGAWAAFHFSTMVSSWLSAYITIDKTILKIISFVIVFIVFAVLLNLLGSLLTKLVKVISLGWLNGLLGLVFGVLKVALILGLVIMLFEGINSSVHIVKTAALDKSVIYNTLKDIGNTVFPYLKSFVTGLNE